MDITFKDRVVMVTGAGRGIGRSVALKLVSLGATVVAVSKSQEKLDALCAEAGDMLVPIQVDLSDWDKTKETLKECAKNIDCLVNNAAWSDEVELGQIDEKVIDDMFNVNYKACLNLIQIVSEGMKERRLGSIVNVSSVSGMTALYGHCVYGSTKSALDMLTKSASKELAPWNIRVNSINPTVVLTDMGEKFWNGDDKKRAMKTKIPLNRFVSVDECVYPIIFLLSSYSSMITGIRLPIDGGLTAQC